MLVTISCLQHVEGDARTVTAWEGAHLVNEGCFRAGGGLGWERAGRRLSVVSDGKQHGQRLRLRQQLRVLQLQCSSGWMEVPLNPPKYTQLQEIHFRLMNFK